MDEIDALYQRVKTPVRVCRGDEMTLRDAATLHQALRSRMRAVGDVLFGDKVRAVFNANSACGDDGALLRQIQNEHQIAEEIRRTLGACPSLGDVRRVIADGVRFRRIRDALDPGTVVI